MKPETLQLLKNLGLGLMVLSVVAGLVWGLWHLTRLPALTIDQVVVTGGETISHAAIQADVEGLLAGTYQQFIPRRFAWTYPHQDIINTLTNTPRVKDPVVERTGTTLQVTLAEFEPVALWCDSGQATGSPCVFLDGNGYGFARAPQLDGGAFTRFVLVGQSATTSAVYADGDDFATLRALEQSLTTFGWPVSRIEFDQARDAFVYLVGDSELKVALGITVAETMDNLQTVLTADEYQHLQPGNFQYIDLRFGNKVFVNEFGEPELENAASSTEEAAVGEDVAQ